MAFTGTAVAASSFATTAAVVGTAVSVGSAVMGTMAKKKEAKAQNQAQAAQNQQQEEQNEAQIRANEEDFAAQTEASDARFASQTTANEQQARANVETFRLQEQSNTVQQAGLAENNRLKQRQANISAQRQIVGSIRAARIQNAQIEQGAVNSGTQGSSGQLGAKGSITSQLAANLGYGNRQLGIARELGANEERTQGLLGQLNVDVANIATQNSLNQIENTNNQALIDADLISKRGQTVLDNSYAQSAAQTRGARATAQAQSRVNKAQAQGSMASTIGGLGSSIFSAGGGFKTIFGARQPNPGFTLNGT